MEKRRNRQNTGEDVWLGEEGKRASTSATQKSQPKRQKQCCRRNSGIFQRKQEFMAPNTVGQARKIRLN